MEKLTEDACRDGLFLPERRAGDFAVAQHGAHPPFSQHRSINRAAEAGRESSVPCVSC